MHWSTCIQIITVQVAFENIIKKKKKKSGLLFEPSIALFDMQILLAYLESVAQNLLMISILRVYHQFPEISLSANR